MIKLLKLLKLLFVFILMTVSSPAFTYENFDECSMAAEEIKKNHNKLSLDEPFYYEYSSIHFQKNFSVSLVNIFLQDQKIIIFWWNLYYQILI